MIHLVFYAIGAVGALVVGLIGASMMKDVQQRVARWLRAHGLQKSVLMSAIVKLDQVGVAIRASVQVMAREVPTETLRIEKSYSMSDVKDPALLAALKKSQHAELDAMSLFA
jgi:hypothetical protein